MNMRERERERDAHDMCFREEESAMWTVARVGQSSSVYKPACGSLGEREIDKDGWSEERRR